VLGGGWLVGRQAKLAGWLAGWLVGKLTQT